jgi:hypothetical protein
MAKFKPSDGEEYSKDEPNITDKFKPQGLRSFDFRKLVKGISFIQLFEVILDDLTHVR